MKLRSAGAAAAALVAGVCAVRRVSRRSGVTAGEVRAPLPGDEIVETPLWESTRAITIDAGPREVWPWIAQMGYPRFRAGWYTPHWLDRLQWGIREQSAERIRPELQDVSVGDCIPDSPDWSVFFTVERVEPGRVLVLRSTRHLLAPMRSIDFTWAFVLDAVGPGRTRLTMRARAICEPRAAWLALGALIGVGDYFNASAMLRGIKRRCERGDVAAAAPSATPGSVMRGAGAVALAAPLFVAAPFLRPWHVRWGASDEEVAGAMPGDELVPEPSFSATRAITIDAPPSTVWPWLVQIGFGRAGFYSYDLLDNAGRESAQAILPALQHPRVGDWVPMAAKVNETTAFRIAGFEPERWLLWTKPHSTWAWTLAPLAGGRTRLVVRLKDRFAWRESPAGALLSLILFEFGDFPMMRKLLLDLRTRGSARCARARGSAP
jgi:hypothetical protein